VFYAPGNHDHIVLRATQDYPDFNCYNTRKYFRVKSGNQSFFMLHGHELEVIAKLTYLTVDEYDKISDQLCRMNDLEGKVASYVHEVLHRMLPGRQPEINDLLQPAESRQRMDTIDKLARSKAKYPLFGMQLDDVLIFGHTHRPFLDLSNKVVNTGAWISDMIVPQWFKDEYGSEKKCYGWYVKIDNGRYDLLPYGVYVPIKKAAGDSTTASLYSDENKEGTASKNPQSPKAETVAERIVEHTSNFVSEIMGKKSHD
jgi:UDP-2,3-diacylglucosamine pyrophosphatase LpxH